MKIFFRSILIVVILMSVLLIWPTQSASAVPIPKTVLVLSPFQLDLSTNLIAAQAIREEFGTATDLSLDIYYEYLDLNRFPDSAYQQKVFDLLTAKYKNKQVDLVIVGSETMLKLWLAQRAEILPNTPVVFFDVFSEHLNSLSIAADVTGVSGVEDCEKTVRWALTAMPGVNEVVLVMGVGKIEQSFFDHIHKLQENMKGQVRFTNLSGLSLVEVKQQVAKLPKTSIVLYHPMFEDAKGNKYRPLEVLRELTATASVPVFGGYDQFLGTGIVGGYMYSIDQQARDVAHISLRVLRGEAISSIPIEQNLSSRYIFDHLELRRFGISLSLLPPESIVRNRQYSFWELYQPQIIATSMGMVILLFVVVYLLFVTQQLNRARLALAHLNANLETQVLERTDLLNQTNTQFQAEITERKQAEEQLRESERRQTTLLSHLPGMAYRCRNDRDWTMEFVSEGCYDLTGYSAENLMENRVVAFGQLIHVDDQTQVWENVQSALATRTMYDLVYRIRSASGTEKWVMERGGGVFSEEDELLALEGFISDITQQKQMESALRASEELNLAILNSLQAHIAVLDSEGMIISVNEPWRNFARSNGVNDLAATVEHVNYLNVLCKAEAINSDEISPARFGIEKVMNGLEPSFQLEYPCDSPNEKRWFTMTVVPLARGKGGVVITHENITERKKDEQALRESEASLQAVLQSTADGILAVDSENRILFVNERFGEMWKIPPSVLAHKDDGILLQHVLEQLINPQEFLEGVQGLYHSEQESFDVLNFKDGRVFERLSHPLIQNEKVSGRVWSFHDVTASKKAEEQLRESEERFRGLLDSQESSIMIFDYEGVHHYANRVSLDSIPISGTDQDIVGKRLHDLYPQAIADWQLEQIRQVFSTGQGLAGDFESWLGNQSSWWHLNLQPIRNASGQVAQVMVNSLNITESKRIEEALRESEARTATILRLSPIVIGVSTVAEGRYTDVNDAFERVLGYSQAETIGRTSHELNIWVDDDSRSQILREIETHGRAENLEIRLRRKSGEIFSALVFITPIELHDTSCLLTMMMDITERYQAEEQLRETRDTLQTIIYSSPLAILTLDQEDKVTMWNPAAEAMFGWSDKQILGHANPTIPETKSKEYEALRIAALSGMAFSNLDTIRIRKDGTQFPVSLSVAPLRGQQSQVIGRMHVIADSTERKKLQEELRQQATTDELTQISNRRHFIELAQNEIKRAARLKRPPAIALIDLDHFKQINDTLGHAAGDRVLIEFSKICQNQIREIDVFARYGGDEFVLLLPETDQEQAYEVLERIRLALTTHPIDINGKRITITISSGITNYAGDQASIDIILSQADKALYHAKESGRNNVVRYDELAEKHT
jgi:diguanylate cyclase (GGDEF)-like protein/PAS domain S-box-containing protein